jgi:hypothetical protein
VGLKKNFLLIMCSTIIAMLANLLPAMTVSALTGLVTISPQTGQVGTVVTITGTGFTSGKTYFINFDGTNILTGTVSSGGFSATYTIPLKPRGNYPFKATTDASDDSNTQNFIVTPSLSISSYSGFVGDSFYVSGNGYYAGSTITVYFDSTAFTTTSESNGAFSSMMVTVVQTYRGSHNIRASDSGGSSPTVLYTVNPKIIIPSPTAAVGSQVTLTGSGFTASSPLTFYIDDVSFPGSGSTDSSGNIPSTTVTVPSVSGGSHTLRVQDSSGGSATTSLSVSSALSVNPQNGPVGTMVTVAGKGFGANKSITLTGRGESIVSNPDAITTDPNGAFTATIKIPAGLAGNYPISATDGTLPAGADFSMKASVNTGGVTSSQVGGNVTLGGSGFTANMPVIIKYDNVQIATGMADASGAFSANIIIPASVAGSHALTASDGISTTTATLSVTSNTILNIANGFVGSEITVTGSGFSAAKTVTIKYDDITNATTTSDASGSFTVVFKAPASKGGNHTITATDGTYSKVNTFAMDSTPPSLPANLLPENKSNADALTKFAWSPSTDPSGVPSYELQVSTDAGFAVIILEKKGLTILGYQTTEAEKFKTVGSDTPYFWRVKAIDGAGNESEWTTPQSFSVGFIFPTWGIYIIFGFVCILAAVGGFWLGRRTSFKWDW